MNKFLIFLWYLITQPFIELKNFFLNMFMKGQVLNYPRTWQKIFFVLTILTYIAGNKLLTNVFGILLILTIIKSEWNSGRFMEKWRARLEKKIEKQIEGETK